jgi:hypothetical protein
MYKSAFTLLFDMNMDNGTLITHKKAVQPSTSYLVRNYHFTIKTWISCGLLPFVMRVFV